MHKILIHRGPHSSHKMTTFLKERMEWSEVQKGHNPDMSKHASDTHMFCIFKYN